MLKKLFLKLLLIFNILLFLVFLPYSISSAHSLGTMGGSQWTVDREKIQVTMELSPDLLNALDGVKKYSNIDLCSKRQLQKISKKILQPYLEKKLSVDINGRKLPITVEKLTKKGYLYNLTLSIDQITPALKKSQNTIKINYQLFFEETDGLHVNVATITLGKKDNQEIQYQFTVDSPQWEGPVEVNPTSARRSIGSTWAEVGEFIILGIKHILTGYDHILFLLALIVIGLSIKDVLKIISAFTVAHSITLFVAALNIIRLNSRFVESVIAFSICYIALENLLRQKANQRWVAAFGFGLIHGFGFASILQDLTITKNNLILSVLSFNLGVEMGQLMIFLVTLPVLNYLKTRIAFHKITVAASLIILTMGSFWFIERVFNLRLLWF